MKRKIIKVGTSAAVIIPREVLKEKKLRVGEFVNVAFDKNTESAKKNLQVDPEVIQWTNKFIEEYRPLLKKLAKS